MTTFERGGVHPPENKELSRAKHLESIDAPEFVCIPMLQHIGAPSKPIVNVGDKVVKGQMIAEAGGFVSIPQHASVSGVVESIDIKQNILGKKVTHITIKSDISDVATLEEKRDPINATPDDLRNWVLNAGIVGMGGAAFPTHVKLTPPKGKKIDTLIINGVECEPYLTSDHELMMEKGKEILVGIRLTMRMLSVNKVVIGIESNKHDSYEKFVSLTVEDDKVDIELLDVKYPQGGEKQLIKALTGREVPSGGLPFDVGVIVHNVSTMYAIWDACVRGRALIERVVTVTGDAVERPANLIVPIGTSIRYLLNRQGLNTDVKKVIAGGPMMGVAIADLDLPITKGSGGILALKELPDTRTRPCIRCGKCITVCPMGLIPCELESAIEFSNSERYKNLNVLDCMECGSCAYICPARRQIVQRIKEAKEMIMLDKIKGEK
ncbi:MAG: electron transport complex subunit RsxC [Pseudomonadota bacterium]